MILRCKTESLLFTRKQWEQHPDYSFTKEELDKAEKRRDSFIGFRNGIKCYLWKYMKGKSWDIMRRVK